MGDVIQGLWIGKALSTMERLSIQSFLANGHEYHLYTYDAVDNVPAGTIVKDGSEILPASMIFKYREHDSYAGFANFFRYKLLLEKGGWWVDTDVVCLKPFTFESDYVLATERDAAGREFVTNGIIRAPRGAELMNRAWTVCQISNPNELRWGETGPNLMHHLTLRSALCGAISPANVFCPIDPRRWLEVVLPGRFTHFGSDTVGVHLWNELWRSFQLDKDAEYAPKSLYEQLKRRYLRP